jgi:hypothetical protein
LGQTLPADFLDVFSPLKRNNSDPEFNGERKEKRLKESTTKFDKSTRDAGKRFSTIISHEGKKEKPFNHSTRRDEIRTKEHELTQKGNFPMH